MIWIISGPTSVGKSTFILSPRCAELTGLGPETPTVWAAADFRLDEIDAGDAFYHYNIMRSARLALRRDEDIASNATRFDRDLPWTEIVRRPTAKRAVVLVASKETIVERIATRTVSEAPEMKNFKPLGGYPSRRWLNIVPQIDVPGLYRAWCAELRDHAIPYVLVNSNDSTFAVIEDETRLEGIVTGDR